MANDNLKPIIHQQRSSSDKYRTAQYGNIKRVDYENWVVDLAYPLGTNGVQEAAITVPFSTPRAIIAGMPEVGSDVLVDYVYGGPDTNTAIVTSYLPTGFRSGIAYRRMLNETQDLATVGLKTDHFRRKFRKLYPGEIFISSTQGSDFLVDENLQLLDMKGDEIRIDSRDQSINQISINNYRISDAARKSEGWVYRYIEEAYYEDGSLVRSFDNPTKGISLEPDIRQPFIYDEALKRRWYRTIRGDTTVDDYLVSRGTEAPDLNSAPLVEVRSEIREVGAAHTPMTDHNVEKDIWGLDRYDNFTALEEEKAQDFTGVRKLLRGNIIESVSGTLVGYDTSSKYYYDDLYGRVLRPQIFADPDTAGFDVRELPVDEDMAPDYTPVRYLAAAYMWKMPYNYSQTRVYVSKEGHTHLHVGSTYDIEDCPYDPPVEHPLGAGRSLEANFGGSIKMVIDKNKQREESLDLKTIGKVYFHFGKDDGVPSNVRRGLLVDNNKDYLGGVTHPKLSAADGANPTATYTSIEGVTDGGITLRVGRNHGRNLRQFEYNGFSPDGKDRLDGGDVRDSNRGMYDPGDAAYQFGTPRIGDNVLKMKTVGYGAPGRMGSTEEEKMYGAGPITRPDLMATSLDAHLVGSTFLRLGSDGDGNSMSFDTSGAIVGWVGAEKKDNRSMVLTMDGGIEAVIGRIANSGNSIQAKLRGGIHLVVQGNNKDQDFKIEALGDQEYDFIGNQTITYEGTIDTTATVDMIRTVGANYSLSVNRHHYSNVSGHRIVTIMNESPPPGEKAANKLTIDKGNHEVRITKQGDMLHEITHGKLQIINKLGDEELKAYIGKIVLEALRDNILIQTELTKIGPKFSIKYPVVTAATGCILTGGAIPHLFGTKHLKVADGPPPSSIPEFPEI